MSMEGSFADSKQAFAHYEGKFERCKRYIVEKTHISKEQLEQHWEKDWWCTAQELLDMGCIDRIVEKISEVL